MAKCFSTFRFAFLCFIFFFAPNKRQQFPRFKMASRRGWKNCAIKICSFTAFFFFFFFLLGHFPHFEMISLGKCWNVQTFYLLWKIAYGQVNSYTLYYSSPLFSPLYFPSAYFFTFSFFFPFFYSYEIFPLLFNTSFLMYFSWFLWFVSMTQ